MNKPLTDRAKDVVESVPHEPLCRSVLEVGDADYDPDACDCGHPYRVARFLLGIIDEAAALMRPIAARAAAVDLKFSERHPKAEGRRPPYPPSPANRVDIRLGAARAQREWLGRQGLDPNHEIDHGPIERKDYRVIEEARPMFSLTSMEQAQRIATWDMNRRMRASQGRPLDGHEEDQDHRQDL